MANGINVQPGHTVALNIDVEQRELAHLIVKGGPMLWGLTRSSSSGRMIWVRGEIPPCADGPLDNIPDYKVAEMNYLLEKKASRLGVRSSTGGLVGVVGGNYLPLVWD